MGKKVGFFAVIALAGCGGKSQAPVAVAPVPQVEVPEWVDRVPQIKGKICALGTAEPTFYREDGKIYAAEAARNQLALTLSVRVQSVMVDVQSSHGPGYLDSSYVQQAQTFATDAVVAGAQVVSYWHDEKGIRGRERATYALGCMGTDSTVAELNAKLAAAHPEDKEKNQQVRDRAKAAFDALETEEQKQASAK